MVALGGLAAEDVRVELYYGALTAEGELDGGQSLAMEQKNLLDNNRAEYTVSLPCDRSGQAGYTVRVLPRRPTVGESLDMALIRWAYQ